MPENFQGTEEHFPLWTAIITSMATQELMADKPLASFNLNCFDFCLLALLFLCFEALLCQKTAPQSYWGKNSPENCLVDLGRDTRTSTQSRRLVRRKGASRSLNWPSGANSLAHLQLKCIIYVPL